MIQTYKKLKEWLGSYRIITKAQLQQKMQSYADSVVEDLNNQALEDLEDKVDLVPNKSGSILIEFDGEGGDFGVLVEIDDLSDSCVKILGLLMLHMARGDIVPFVYESLAGWAEDDDFDERMEFNSKLLGEIAEITNILTEELKASKKTAAIKASEVFNYRKREQ